LSTVPWVLADAPPTPTVNSVTVDGVIERVKAAWETGALNGAFETLEQGIQAHPQSPALQKLRGDILSTVRRPQDAVQAYDKALGLAPRSLEVRWARWSVLLRSGLRDDAIAELQRLAQLDDENPLVHLRLAQELRKLDRLEESLATYQKAIALTPSLLSWRLGMARARYDVLDYQGAYSDVQTLLRQMPPGSPLEVSANNLLAEIVGPISAKGRRFKAMASSDVPAKQRREWAAIRADAWRLFSDGRYGEAEPIYRKLLSLNPNDATAAYQLGLILMDSGRCKEAVAVFRTMTNLEVGEEEYADTVFRMGQCLVELEQWEEAFVYFTILHEAAAEFEASNKDRTLPGGMRVLSKEKLARWLAKVRPHVPHADQLLAKDHAPSPTVSEDEFYAKIAAARLTHKAVETRASLMGRDADFSWFRFVIPAGKVMRDDAPTGEHDFIPIDPNDSFPATQREIYLVFGLVSSSYDAVPLTARCFVEAAELTGEPPVVAQDSVIAAMSDQSGFFTLAAPKNGWPSGLYRCGLFAGERATADTHVDEVRFRIVEPRRRS
jgi:tetratricopeptide (TPR) repeat protein